LKFMIFSRATETITINIGGDGSKRLILPKWSSNLLKHELSSMRLVHCNETLANQTRINYPGYFNSTHVLKNVVTKEKL